jgi:hypothetical protein
MTEPRTGLEEDLRAHRRTVDTEYFDLSLREIVRMVEEEEIRIAPEYQRQFRWKEETRSALIESFLLGLPVPSIFVATNQDATWEVVDGLQRICTVLHFMGIDAPESEKLQFSNSPLVLSDLRTLKNFEGLQYSTLPRPIRLTFEKRYIRVQVLSDKSDTDVRFELFRRLNAGAIALTGQEIRSCIYQGPFNDMIEELVNDKNYRKLIKLRKNDTENGTAEEIVLKFFAYLNDRESFVERVTDFLNQYMQKHVKETNLDEYRAIFLQTVEFLAGVLAGRPFVRRGTSVTPLNELEAVMVGVGQIFRSGERPVEPAGDWLNDPELVRFSTKGTNTRPQLNGRINRAVKLFGGHESVQN